MIKNYFKITFRNLIKNKSYTFINVGGLSLGIVCALVLFLIIRFEFSFDTYHTHAKDTYRIVVDTHEFGSTRYDPGVPYPLPEAVRNDFEGVEYLTIVDSNFRGMVLSYENENGERERFSLGDWQNKGATKVTADYFKIFDYKWRAGNPEVALDRPGTAVISRGLATTLFGSVNPMGKIITIDNSQEVEITGVVEDAPENTDLPFTFFIYSEVPEWGRDNWSSTSTSVQCYLTLKEGVDPQAMEQELGPFLEKYVMPEEAETTQLLLQPLSEVHFDTRYENFSYRVVSAQSLWALALIGLFLLLTACINFINLNTALAVRRSKEVGVRKVLGGSRLQLVLHFMGETAMITLLALVCSLVMAEFILNNLQGILGYQLELNLLSDPVLISYLFGLVVVVTIAAGLYPSMVLSGFSPIDAVRNKITASYREGISLRKSLVVTQFAISQVLIIAIIVIWSQLNYFNTADMGFDKEAIVEVDLPFNQSEAIESMRSGLLQHTAIRNVSYSNTSTANGNIWTGNFKLKQADRLIENRAQIKFVDRHFIDTYGLRLVAGKKLAENSSDSLKQYVVNQAFARETGYGTSYNELVGMFVEIWGAEGEIVGVVEDFNTESFHEEIQPTMLTINNRYSLAGIRINQSQISEALAVVRQEWERTYPNYVFDYTFLDESIRSFYEDEQRTSQLMNTFGLVAILIGSLGLFGLVSYMANTRTKEIGIRKVLGASLGDILEMFSKEFAVLIVAAFIIAAPVGWYFMQKWLSDFAYRIDLGFGIFVFSLVASFGIAFLTVGWRSLKAATANPVESLKSE